MFLHKHLTASIITVSSGQLVTLCPFFLHLKHFPCFINICLSLNINALHPSHWGLSSLLVCTSFCLSSPCHSFCSGQSWLLLLNSLCWTGLPSQTSHQLFLGSLCQTWSCVQGSNWGFFGTAQLSGCYQRLTLLSTLLIQLTVWTLWWFVWPYFSLVSNFPICITHLGLGLQTGMLCALQLRKCQMLGTPAFLLLDLWYVKFSPVLCLLLIHVQQDKPYL